MSARLPHSSHNAGHLQAFASYYVLCVSGCMRFSAFGLLVAGSLLPVASVARYVREGARRAAGILSPLLPPRQRLLPHPPQGQNARSGTVSPTQRHIDIPGSNASGRLPGAA